ncbi:uncharacterized protein LOC128818317 [Vidua macroura]|uniref:uncharacterized protein LOC128818317 n=1 Tax=Vidua macroura TaxID=187451 RepID=UPI0023A88E21|nr:uncharacterized protein LOC128818317 [Vidua macroura]
MHHRLDATVPTGLLQGDGCRASVTSQPLGTVRWLASAASPCPEPGQKRARTERGQSLCVSRSSTMAGQGFPWLLPLALLVILDRPLDTSSRPAGDAGTSALLAEVPEQWDVCPATTPLEHVELLSLSCVALDLLVTGVSLSWWLRKRLRSCWREEKHQSPSVSAGTGCQRHGCCKELLQLLRDNRALMRLCVRPLQRPRKKKPRKWGIWNRRRLYFSPGCCLSSPALHL